MTGEPEGTSIPQKGEHGHSEGVPHGLKASMHPTGDGHVLLLHGPKRQVEGKMNGMGAPLKGQPIIFPIDPRHQHRLQTNLCRLNDRNGVGGMVMDGAARSAGPRGHQFGRTVGNVAQVTG